MDRPRQEEKIGAGWIAAMIVLVALIVLGVVLYARMSAPLQGADRTGQTGTIRAGRQCAAPSCRDYPFSPCGSIHDAWV